DQHAAVFVKLQVVGDERSGQHLFNHRVAALSDTHAGFVDEARPVQVEVQRSFGQVAQYVQLGQGSGTVLQWCKVVDELFQQLVVEHFLSRQGAALGRKSLVLEFLEFRGDEALG